MAKKPVSFREFDQRFPDDDACLEHLMRVRYGDRFDCPKCKREARYYRIRSTGARSRRAYSCEHCGHQVFPTVGTPFENARLPLRAWFVVMHMFTTTRNGVAAKEIQRHVGCGYKAAFRMGHLIRKYMAYVDGAPPLGGPEGGNSPVEIDHTFVGGADRRGSDDKKIALGMLERGGEVIVKHVPDASASSAQPIILSNVKRGARVMTDEASTFKSLGGDYEHQSVNHSRREYVRGAVHVNSLEGFWGIVKREVYGTHVHVSEKYFQNYLGEISYRYNFRHDQRMMFEALVHAFAAPAR